MILEDSDELSNKSKSSNNKTNSKKNIYYDDEINKMDEVY